MDAPIQGHAFMTQTGRCFTLFNRHKERKLNTMRRQESMLQRTRKKNLEKSLNETKINNLPDRVQSKGNKKAN